MEILVDPEELISCPYNKCHHILRRRMAFHLLRCKKNYPDARMVACDFNVTHMIPEPEIQYHHEHCPDRKHIEITIYRESVLPHGRSIFIKLIGEEINKYPVHNVPVETDETWDDYNVSTYDPKQYCEQSNIIRKLDIESAAIKKRFCFMERERLRHLSVEDEETPIKKPTKFRKPVFPKMSKNLREFTSDEIRSLVDRIKRDANKPFNTTIGQ